MTGENRAGVIDIGSRSIKLLIGQVVKDDIEVIESLKNVVPIAHDAFLKNRISQETINQTVSILEKYKQVLRDYKIDQLKVVATTAMREAQNRDLLTDTLYRKTGLSVEVLTGGDIVYYIDAYLSYKLKDTYPIHEKNILIAELGSGSLDISVMEQGFTQMHITLPLGTLRLKQLMSKLNRGLRETTDAVTEYIHNEFVQLGRMLPPIKIDDVILIDENYAPYLSSILSAKVRTSKFFSLRHHDAQSLRTTLTDRKAEEITKSYRVPAEISDTFAAYAILLNMFFSLIHNEEIYLLETSLAEAILAHTLLELELSKKYNKTNQLLSVARAIGRKYDTDLEHAAHVAGLSEKIFNGLREQMGLKKDTLLHLLLAAHLHDIGMFIHNRAHHKHSEYIISSLNFSRLSDDELKLIACIARYHRKAAPSENHLLYGSLSSAEQLLVQKLSAILRVANALDRSHRQKIKDIEVKTGPAVTISFTADSDAILETQDFQEKKGALEEILGATINLTTRR